MPAHLAAAACSPMCPTPTATRWFRSSTQAPRSSNSTNSSPITSWGTSCTLFQPANRQLMTLILRKLLASSTYAISDTLLGLATKLETAEADQQKAADVPASLADDLRDASRNTRKNGLMRMKARKRSPTEPTGKSCRNGLSPEQLAELRAEKDKLHRFHALAKAIQTNSKGDAPANGVAAWLRGRADSSHGRWNRRSTAKGHHL